MDAPQPSLGFLLADVSRLMRRAFQQRLEGSSLTLAQARTLVLVSRHEGIRQVDLAELLEVQPITLARLLDQLAAAGLVERRRDPGDRRAWRLFLRPAAAAQLDATQQVSALIHTDALRGLSPRQVADLLQALGLMRHNLACGTARRSDLSSKNHSDEQAPGHSRPGDI